MKLPSLSEVFHVSEDKGKPKINTVPTQMNRNMFLELERRIVDFLRADQMLQKRAEFITKFLNKIKPALKVPADLAFDRGAIHSQIQKVEKLTEAHIRAGQELGEAIRALRHLVEKGMQNPAGPDPNVPPPPPLDDEWLFKDS